MGTATGAAEPELLKSDKQRFEQDLEFVQCLANAEYVSWLAQNRHFEDPAFLAYLKYLRYWQQPEYSLFITFPQCLHMLELVQEPAFQKAMARRDLQVAVAWQQHYFFTHTRSNQLRAEQRELAAE